MAVYDLEEQEQLEDLKAWWKRWGNLVSGIVIAVCVGASSPCRAGAGGSTTRPSRRRCSTVRSPRPPRGNDLAKAKDAMAQLADSFARHRLRAARRRCSSPACCSKPATRPAPQAQLQFVIDRASEDDLQQIARFRLAEVLFDEKQYDDALRTLDAKHDEPFAGIYADLRGDILAAAGRTGGGARRLPDRARQARRASRHTAATCR